ncbi:cell division protein FtsW [Psychroflexus torquis ATCC 700755]|uniref:Probable peptidoglycan glycosyltransferase FtsW n=1 Tax=Psychroflexus torquis (strain ATCC 700755 / CIP 106069 / ACAM 623) TaxID=313595 RepID=K4IH15_PSYTT|nr:FtsW/RodA/SpoVE family cell cycle protein [Psychroflexus torquis]AFU69822.1 cell division protein FtsW [Psychroflexus torquis ATCC 700755]
MSTSKGLTDFLKSIKGDRMLWSVAALLAIFSFIPVYSASSNLAYLNGASGSTFAYLVKHFIHLVLGFSILYATHKIPYHYFRGLSIILLPIVIVLLIVTLLQGTTMQGANASRWIQVPIVNFSFQTSTLASVVLLIYVARYLSKIKDTEYTFKETILPLWVPVFLVVGLILPANLSTAAIIFFIVLILTFVGGYTMKYTGAIVGIGMLSLVLFGLTAKAFPDLFPNRVDTWISRIETFTQDEQTKEQYQVEKAKIAIATGGITGNGIGKSVQRNFLPQSSSDFIYAIIVEEMGMVGGIGVILAYLFMLYRIAIIVTKSETAYGRLLVIAAGIPIIFQAFVNIAVAVEFLPVTGQTLPLVGSGGTSIWMTCLSLGIVISVSANNEVRSIAEAKEKEREDNQAIENPLEVLSETI